MRLPYVEDPPKFTDSESTEIVDRIRERRLALGLPGLVELDRALLHSPPVANGWNSFLGAIRNKTALSVSISELIICRVAALNKAAYEWKHHEPLLRRGLLSEVINSSAEAERDAEASKIISVVQSGSPEDLSKFESLDAKWVAKAAAVLQYTDSMTKDVEVPVGVWEELKKCCQETENSDRELVEITATCAAYNCVSRFLVALAVGE